MQCSSPGPAGAEQVARVHGALGLARAHDGVQLVDKEDDAALGLLTSLRTAFSRSSNSPRYLAPAIRNPCPGRKWSCPSGGGDVPLTMRWASPSAMAVLPTPGSPMSTGLFLLLRLRIRMTLRISSSRPMTGSSLLAWPAPPGRAVLLQGVVGLLRVVGGHTLVAPHVGQGLEHALLLYVVGAEQLLQLPVGRVQQGQQQVLHRHILVLHGRGDALGGVEALVHVLAT